MNRSADSYAIKSVSGSDAERDPRAFGILNGEIAVDTDIPECHNASTARAELERSESATELLT
jgi:hypothetical protein